MPYSEYNEQDESLFRQIIMDHHRNPRYKGLVDNPGYVTVHLKNPSCGDDLTVQVKFDGQNIVDIRHMGTGCAICCSSADVMSTLLRSRSIEDAEACIRQFKLMVSDQPFDEGVLEDAIAFHGVASLPPRIKCATLAWLACEEAIGVSQQELETSHHDEKE